MHFLKKQDKRKRLLLQVEAYQNTLDFKLANALCQIDTFDLQKQDLSIDAISSLDISKKLRLGNRVEYFFEWLLNRQYRFQILSKSIQIIENKITLGELDFLVLDKLLAKTIHIEISSKFYLYDANITKEEERWIGPNRNDSLVQKCHKLRTKQFPLLKHSRTKEIIETEDIKVSEIIQKLNFKAQLFLARSEYLNQNEKNIAGFYIYLKTFKTEIFKSYEYFIPEKQDWFVNPQHGEIWFSHQEALESISLHFEDKKSPLIWVKKPDGVFEKMFVVWW